MRGKETLSPIGYGPALGREFFRMLLVAFFYIPFFIDGLWPLWDRGKQTLHHKVARTVVVRL